VVPAADILKSKQVEQAMNLIKNKIE